MARRVNDDSLPAWSLTLTSRAATGLSPSPKDSSAGHGLGVANPDVPSVQVQLTVTNVLFQPAALAAGTDALSVGATVSTFTARRLTVEEVFPATSVIEKSAAPSLAPWT